VDKKKLDKVLLDPCVAQASFEPLSLQSPQQTTPHYPEKISLDSASQLLRGNEHCTGMMTRSEGPTDGLPS
jgi:hypothetical protein